MKRGEHTFQFKASEVEMAARNEPREATQGQFAEFMSIRTVS